MLGYNNRLFVTNGWKVINPHVCKNILGSQATIFLFLGLRISWRQKRVGRSEKKKKKFQKALLCQVVEKSYRYMEIVIKSDVLRNY